MDQEKLNKKVLGYFRERLKNYSYCTKEFIKSEELRAASIENYELAEAIRLAFVKINKSERRGE